VSVDDRRPAADSTDDADAYERSPADWGPLGVLPRLVGRQVRLTSRLARVGSDAGLGAAVRWLNDELKSEAKVGPPEVLWRPSGLRRTGLVAHLVWPRLSTRLGLGVETPLAHAVVDRLLGFFRLDEESHRQLSPVEWGVMTFAVAETFHRLDDTPGPLGPWDLVIDRVGPDPFDLTGLGQVVTVRWPVRLGSISGSLRVWLPENLVTRWLKAPPVPSATAAPPLTPTPGQPDLAGDWRARAGTVSLPRGLKTLRPGGVLPLTESRLEGTPQSPAGQVELTLALAGSDGHFILPAEPVASSGGAHLTLTGPLRHVPSPREPIAVSNQALTPNPDPTDAQATQVPVTLVVELGRVNLTVARLADLKPGDVVELGRHSREPVELTSAGRLVARGELVQIDTELGVRVTHVFL
jgi:flagellar motor switch/type III secretory pathway protein FliN